LLRCTLVGFGTKRTFAAMRQLIALGGKADIERHSVVGCAEVMIKKIAEVVGTGISIGRLSA
jgi:hypothetical protein